ncbi:MAG: hypothetical protein ACXWUG_23310 [Polyangiales bacterium]
MSRLRFSGEHRLLALSTRGEVSLHDLSSSSVEWRTVVCQSDPFDAVIVEKELWVGCGPTLSVLELSSGRLLSSVPLPGLFRGFVRTSDVILSWCIPVKTDRTIVGELRQGSFEPLYELPFSCTVLATSPSGSLVFGWSGLRHMVVDLATRERTIVHEGLGHRGVFLEEDLLVDKRKSDIAIDAGPKWERIGTIAFKAHDLAMSHDRKVIAAVGSARGWAWTREELLESSHA